MPYPEPSQQTGKELAPLPTRAEIEHNALGKQSSLARAVVPGVLGGVVASCCVLGHSLWAFAILPFMLLALYLVYGKEGFGAGIRANRIPETTVQGAAKKILTKAGMRAAVRIGAPIVGSFLVSLPLVQALPPAAGVASVVVLMSIGMTFAVKHAATTDNAMGYGKQRARELLKENPLEGVTEQRLELMSDPINHAVAQALAVLGAVDGTQVKAWRIHNALGQESDDEKERILNSLKTMEKAGLVHVNAIEGPRDPDKWFFELRPAGVRTLVNLGKR